MVAVIDGSIFGAASAAFATRNSPFDLKQIPHAQRFVRRLIPVQRRQKNNDRTKGIVTTQNNRARRFVQALEKPNAVEAILATLGKLPKR